MAFFSLLSLKYLYISFFRSLPAPCLLPCSSLFPPPLRLSSAPAPAVCSVAAVCRLVCPLPPPRPRGLFRPVFCVFIPSGTPLKLPGGLLCVVPCVLWWLPLLVRYQAQNGVTVWADAARIYPRPCLLLPMCCRVFRCPFRGFRPSVRVCVRVCVLPCVVWW